MHISRKLAFYTGIMFFIVLPLIVYAVPIPPPDDPPPPGNAEEYWFGAAGEYVSGGIWDTWTNNGQGLEICSTNHHIAGDLYEASLYIYFKGFIQISMIAVLIDIIGFNGYYWEGDYTNLHLEYIPLKIKVKHSHGWHSAKSVNDGYNDINVPDGKVKTVRLSWHYQYTSLWGPIVTEQFFIDLLKFYN
ncbi:MAG: hypothetical protein ACFFDH_16005 [Promethearchaeota archaeon]